MSEDGFSKLLATGLTAVFALQAFVIVGGVTRVIPLTGVTLPFVSYGGSSVVANFVLLALLLMVSEQARAPRRGPQPGRQRIAAVPDARRCRAREHAHRNLFGLVVLLFGADRLHVLLVGVRCRRAGGEPGQQAAAARGAADPPRADRRATGRCSRATGAGPSPRFYERVYPQGALFGHPVGYSFVERGRVALEREYNDELTGKHDEFHTIFDELRGASARATTSSRRSTRRPAHGDRSARRRTGAIVAIEPATGRVRTMVSVPGYDPNSIVERFSDLRRAPVAASEPHRAERLPAGSTFKVVTATAAIDSGRYTPQSFEDGKSPKEIGGVPLTNFGGRDFGRSRSPMRSRTP